MKVLRALVNGEYKWVSLCLQDGTLAFTELPVLYKDTISSSVIRRVIHKSDILDSLEILSVSLLEFDPRVHSLFDKQIITQTDIQNILQQRSIEISTDGISLTFDDFETNSLGKYIHYDDLFPKS